MIEINNESKRCASATHKDIRNCVAVWVYKDGSYPDLHYCDECKKEYILLDSNPLYYSPYVAD